MCAPVMKHSLSFINVLSLYCSRKECFQIMFVPRPLIINIVYSYQERVVEGLPGVMEGTVFSISRAELCCTPDPKVAYLELLSIHNHTLYNHTVQYV